MIDYIYEHRATHKSKKGPGKEHDENDDSKDFMIRQFNQRVLYDFYTVILVVFDFDRQQQEYTKR